MLSTDPDKVSLLVNHKQHETFFQSGR